MRFFDKSPVPMKSHAKLVIHKIYAGWWDLYHIYGDLYQPGVIYPTNHQLVIYTNQG